MEKKKWYCESWAKEVAKEMWKRCSLNICEEALDEDSGMITTLNITTEYLDGIEEEDYDIDDLQYLVNKKMFALQKEWTNGNPKQ